MKAMTRIGWALLALLVSATSARAEDEDDLSTDALGDQKGSDRVSAEDAQVDRSRANVFEKERFFIDKIDSAATEDATLFQGNFISSTFLYSESGDKAAGGTGVGVGGAGSNSQFSRLFTDLRFQLDARHIKGGRWQARVDARGRLTSDPEDGSASATADTRIQSGLTGTSEAELKELWLTRPGDRYDIFLGRQFIPDLGAVKIDGIRIDYAKSDRVTVLGFAGAYPVRGSRTIGTDYPVLKDSVGNSLGRTPPVAGGLGAAYRTTLSYGSFGGGTIAPLKGEIPRVFVTANGYTRTGPKLDLYHFALIDVVSEGGFSINNLSAGLNVRPSPALRLTASVNHVDTETLAVQARAFLENPDDASTRNDSELRRVASTQAHAGLSASVGQLQQLEVSVGLTGRYRPEVTAGTNTFQASKNLDVLGQIVHRNLLSSRIGLDAIRSFGLGGTSTRSTFLTLRVFMSREFRQGRGSWEGELAYSNTKDESSEMFAFGKSKTSTISAAGTVYYRLRTSLFAMASAGFGRFALSTVATGTNTSDPAVSSLTGFLRLAYRF
ncbi:MAG: hypothetical protein R3B48_01900 [Kofleriaceae bacterium]